MEAFEPLKSLEPFEACETLEPLRGATHKRKFLRDVPQPRAACRPFVRSLFPYLPWS